MKNLSLFFISIVFSVVVLAQQGGERGYSYLQIATNARSAAMGGQLISHQGSINQIADNPALLDSGKQNISFNYANYIADINGGSVFFHPHQKLKKYAFSMQYFNYGNFLETDESGNITGEFSAGDYSLAAYRVIKFRENLTFGVSSNMLFSFYPQSFNMGLGVSAGAYYTKPEKEFSAGLVIKNVGLQIINQAEVNNKLPFEVQLGLSKQLDKAPFRISLLAHNLQTWDLSYPNPDEITIDPFTGEEIKQWFSLDKLMRHFSGGVEFFPAKSFVMRFSYNHQRRREMSLNQKSGFAGFGVGAGIRFNKFTLDYGITGYHIAGALHMFSINTKI